MAAERFETTSTDLSFDHQTAMAWTMPVTLVMLAAVLAPHAAVYRENPFAELWSAVPFYLLGPLMAGSIVVHELLHAVTAIVGARLRWADVSYGVHWNTLTPYAHPRVAITARAYAATAAMPGIVLGIVPSAVGLFTGSGACSAYGAVMLAAASGDALILWRLRGTAGTALVQDHPSRVGCYVVSEDGKAPLAPPPASGAVSPDSLRRGAGYGFLLGVAAGTAAAVVAVLN